LGPNTNIFGISTSGELLFLSDDTTVCPGPIGVCSVSQTIFTFSNQNPSSAEWIGGITALGGFFNSPEHGTFAVSGDCSDFGMLCKVYNVYFDNEWKAQQIVSFQEWSYCLNPNTGRYCTSLGAHVYIGTYSGKVYILNGVFGKRSEILELTSVGGSLIHNLIGDGFDLPCKCPLITGF
jgi:hypothetical protein